MVLGIVFLAVLLLDQVSKALAYAMIGAGQSVSVIPGFPAV